MACASHLHLFWIFADSRNCASSIAWIIYLPPESPKNINQHTPLNVRISSPRNCYCKSTAQNCNFSMFPCFFFRFKTTKSKIIHHPSCWDGTIFFVLKQVWIKNGFHPIFQIFRWWENPPRICQVTWRARPYPLVVGSCTLAALIGGCGFAGCDFVSIYRHTAPVYTILAWWKCS